jgi:hypothetical protein
MAVVIYEKYSLFKVIWTEFISRSNTTYLIMYLNNVTDFILLNLRNII